MVVKKQRSVISKAGTNDTKNIYKSLRKYSNRNQANFDFPEFEIKIAKMSTVVLLLESDEVDVVQRVKVISHSPSTFQLMSRTSRPSITSINSHRSATRSCTSSTTINSSMASRSKSNRKIRSSSDSHSSCWFNLSPTSQIARRSS